MTSIRMGSSATVSVSVHMKSLSADSQLGWKADGSLVQRYYGGYAWLARGLTGAGTIGAPAGDARATYGLDGDWHILWYGADARALGWTWLGASPYASGVIEAGKVWPGSSTWVSSATHYVFCRDGVGAGTKIRVIYYSGGWKSAVVGEYPGFQGDQAQAQASGRLYHINANDGSLLSLGW